MVTETLLVENLDNTRELNILLTVKFKFTHFKVKVLGEPLFGPD